MGYSYLLSLEASLSSFRATYNVPNDVDIAYCHEGDIDLHRRIGSNTVFFPLMAILEGGVRFLVDPLINFMYNLCGNIRTDYYLKTMDMRVQLISCLPNSNRNSTGEFF